VDCKKLGEEAYERYFSRIDGDDKSNLLESIIVDIAKREELNPEQIARVCQYANTKVFLKLFKTVKDKTFEFAVADPEKVVRALYLQRTPSESVGSEELDDIHFTLDDVEEFPEEVRLPEVIDFAEVVKLERKLQDRLDDIAIKTMEERPWIIKRLISRIREHGPIPVFIAVRKVGGPEDLLKAACEGAKVDYDSVTIPEGDYIVDDGDPLLQKVAAYGKMLTERQVYEEDLQKVATVKGLIAGAKKVPGKALGATIAYAELKDVATKTKNAKNQILSDAPLTNRFSVKNLPRRMEPGQRGYIG